MLIFKPEQGPMLVTWVDRWSMSSIIGAKVLDPNLRSPG